MKLNTKIVKFVIGFRIKYDDDKSLKEAVKHIKHNLGYSTICAGDHNYEAKMLKPKVEGEKRGRKTLKELEQPNQLQLSMGVVEKCQTML